MKILEGSGETKTRYIRIRFANEIWTKDTIERIKGNNEEYRIIKMNPIHMVIDKIKQNSLNNGRLAAPFS
jgi:hypothetical protein